MLGANAHGLRHLRGRLERYAAVCQDHPHGTRASTAPLPDSLLRLRKEDRRLGREGCRSRELEDGGRGPARAPRAELLELFVTALLRRPAALSFLPERLDSAEAVAI